MATLHVDTYDEDDVELPNLCMKCGAPASVHRRKTFSWYPPWVFVLLVAGVVPFAILAMIMTKKRTLTAPLCAAHKGHWLMRQLLVLGSLFGLIALGIVSLAVVAANDTGRHGDKPLGFLCFGWLFLMLVWVVTAAVVQMTTIRPTEITDDSITLTGVAAPFVEAYEEESAASRDRLDKLARERWDRGRRRPARRVAEEDDEDDVPPGGYRRGR